MKSIEDIKILLTDIIKKYINEEIESKTFLSKMDKLIGNNKYWIRFYDGDSLCTTMRDISDDFKLQHIPNYNYQHLIERMKYAVENNSLQIHKS